MTEFKKTLNGAWELNLHVLRDSKLSEKVKDESFKKYENVKSQVPGEVHMDLMNNQLIPDLYIGEKEIEYRWIASSDWRFTREFKVTNNDIKDFENVELVCDGIDTVADIYINDIRVNGEKPLENMFRVYRFNIKSLLKIDESNKIEIIIFSPAKYSKDLSNLYKYEVPLWEYPNGVHHRNFIRKCACHFGWDWGPCFCPLGIYKDIYIDFYTIPRIESILIQSTKDSVLKEYKPSKLDVAFKLSSEIKSNTLIDIKIFEEGEKDMKLICNFKSEILIGLKSFSTLLEISESKLWWPNGYGNQSLYRCIITLNSSEKYNGRFGIRNLQLDTSKDQYGNKFQFVVNGVPVFAKGADWIPIDHFITRITKDQYQHLLWSTKEANMNCLRVWGGGIYENDYFYDLCDQYGILLWQDFMFGCALYPTDQEFLENVKQEVRDQVRRIGNHPSIALWCGSNESEQAIIDRLWDPIKKNPHRYTIDYNQLYIETIQPTLQIESPSSYFWPSSPSNGVGEWGDCNNDTRGDTHYWAVWHSDMPFTQYLKSKSRFLSEFGFQSLPSYSELKKVITSEDQLNITSPEMEGRQRSPKPGNLGILRHIGLHFRVPGSFEDMCFISQVLQGISIKAGCEHWRRMRPYCMGTLYWQLNDIWVGPSWSSIEYNGRWKALHYFSKKFYEPLLLSINEPQEDKDLLEIWITNDNHDIPTTRKAIQILFMNLIDSSVSKEISIPHEVILNESSRPYVTLQKSEVFSNLCPRDLIIRCLLKEEDNDIVGENIYYPCAFKQLNLKKTTLSITSIQLIEKDKSIELKIESLDSIALFVWIDYCGNKENKSNSPIQGYFSENGFYLDKNVLKTIYFYPSSSQSIKLSPSLKTNQELFKIKSLRDTY